MASQHNNFPHPPPTDNTTQRATALRPAGNMSHSESIPQRLRNEDSWVEISSQPSSSSLSSIGDEIVTTGLRVQHDAIPRRRRRAPVTSVMAVETRQAGTSSQEEYEESESESDRVMTSSNEQLAASPIRDTRQEYDAGSDSDEYSENATALGRRTEPTATNLIFTPQPNAFSHPPSSQANQGPLEPSSYVRRSSQPNPSSCSPFPSPALPRTQRHSSSQADHDAALRASLTTLLSIGAAAARGLPKRQASAPSGNEPVSLRLVPESEIMPPAPAPATTNSSRPLSPSTRARSSPSVSSQEAVALDRSKRKASEKSQTKKKKIVRLADGRMIENAETTISPTLLTWVVSAGVLVLVSVVGFGAGYVIGWEVGRQEALAAGGVNGSMVLGDGTASCGREVVRGSGSTLRRFRWGSNVARSIVA